MEVLQLEKRFVFGWRDGWRCRNPFLKSTITSGVLKLSNWCLSSLLVVHEPLSAHLVPKGFSSTKTSFKRSSNAKGLSSAQRSLKRYIQQCRQHSAMVVHHNIGKQYVKTQNILNDLQVSSSMTIVNSRKLRKCLPY